MTLAPLAGVSDLTARAIVVPPGVDASVLLAAASDAVRESAGCAITQVSSTITLPAPADQWLDLPAGPVTIVSSVTLPINGVPTVLVPGDDYTKIADALWRWNEWAPTSPAEVVITYTHGYAVIPNDIIDLVCSLVGLAMAQAADGTYGVQASIQSERLGDYSVAFMHGSGVQSSERSPSPMQIPEGTREWLRQRFGTSVAVVSQRA